MDKTRILTKGLKAINYLIYTIPTILVIGVLSFQDEASFKVDFASNVGELSPMSFKWLQIVTDFLGIAVCDNTLFHIISSALWMIAFDMVYSFLQKKNLLKSFKFSLI